MLTTAQRLRRPRRLAPSTMQMSKNGELLAFYLSRSSEGSWRPAARRSLLPELVKKALGKVPLHGRGVGRSGSGVKTKSSKRGAARVFLDHQSSSVQERKPYVEWLAYTCIASGLGTVTSLVAFRHGSWLLLPSSSAPFPFCTHTHNISATHGAREKHLKRLRTNTMTRMHERSAHSTEDVNTWHTEHMHTWHTEHMYTRHIEHM